jgi:ABC-type arginine/histidine transport system permease subunit
MTLSATNTLYVTGTDLYSTTIDGTSLGQQLFLNYYGGPDNYIMSFATVMSVGANTPLFDWYGTATNSTNIYPVSARDIGGTITIINQ